MDRKIKKHAIAHYEKMIRFAESQPMFEAPSADLMEDSISESWFGRHCVFCLECTGNVYRNRSYTSSDFSERPDACSLCKLSVFSHSLYPESVCCAGLWWIMNNSKTWVMWTARAKKVLEYIEEHG